jgi:urate oxidase
MAYSTLSSSTYGKDNVKFLKVKKDPHNPKKQEVIEATVKVLLEGDFDISYTKADNSPIVPTDTVKNTILILAKTTEVWPIERFAAKLATHFVEKYSHVSGVSVSLIQDRWVKYNVNGQLHDHSFIHEGAEKKITNLYYKRTGDYKLSSSIKDLTVLKSTRSMFYGYNKCDFTTLQPTTDRILSTDVDAVWEFDSKKLGSIYDISKLAEKGLFDTVYNIAREITLTTFALENSPSVQATMFNMATDILKKADSVYSVSYSLPNKHYFLFDLEWKGLKNDNELFYPSPHPNGLIKCTVVRENKNKL